MNHHAKLFTSKVVILFYSYVYVQTHAQNIQTHSADRLQYMTTKLKRSVTIKTVYIIVVSESYK